MTAIAREEAIKRLPRSPTGWIYPVDENLPVFQSLVDEGIATRRGYGFQMKEKSKK